ncbi:hypothetical protein EB796_005119 [Bugula neritina]|uniref:Uncharacterized protein n=1 Tax=Bugula neritina TaxID=10212 RepID=A0A7J7KED3_BUGNE|nr:hypothetical protein EB796_005119 [Bugula neritina]
MSKKSSARTFGPLSMGFPDPLKTLPNMSSLTGVLKMSPFKVALFFLTTAVQYLLNVMTTPTVNTHS